MLEADFVCLLFFSLNLWVNESHDNLKSCKIMLKNQIIFIFSIKMKIAFYSFFFYFFKIKFLKVTTKYWKMIFSNYFRKFLLIIYTISPLFSSFFFISTPVLLMHY